MGGGIRMRMSRKDFLKASVAYVGNAATLAVLGGCGSGETGGGTTAGGTGGASRSSTSASQTSGSTAASYRSTPITATT